MEGTDTDVVELERADFYKDVKEDKGVVNSINAMVTRSLLDGRLLEQAVISGGKERRQECPKEKKRKRFDFDVSLDTGWRENGKLRH
jgi:hypothetical protein